MAFPKPKKRPVEEAEPEKLDRVAWVRSQVEKLHLNPSIPWLCRKHPDQDAVEIQVGSDENPALSKIIYFKIDQMMAEGADHRAYFKEKLSSLAQYWLEIGQPDDLIFQSA